MWKKSVLIAAILVGFLIHQLVPHSHDILASQKVSVSAEKIPSTFDLLKKAVADGEHGCQLHDVQLSSCDCSVDVYLFVDSIISAQEVAILSNPITTVAFFREKPPLYSGSILAHSRRGPPSLA